MDDFKIKRATVTFTYSFLPATKELIYDKKIINSLINSVIEKSSTNDSGNGKPSIEPIYEDPRNRKGLSSYLALNTLSGYECIQTIDAKLNSSINVKIFPVFRYFSYGCSLTFHLVATKNTKDYITVEEAYPLMHLVSNEWNKEAVKKLTFTQDGQEKTLYTLFKELVLLKLVVANKVHFSDLLRKECDELPKAINENNDLKKDILEFLSEKKYLIDIKPNIPNDNNQDILREFCLKSKERYRLDDKTTFDVYNFISNNIFSLLCYNENLLDYNSAAETNVPWVITNLELEDGRVLQDFCSDFADIPRNIATQVKIEEIRNYDQYLAHFLYRLVDESFLKFKVEPAYDSYNNSTRYNGFDNMYLDARFYLHATRRSILTITGNNYHKPGSYFLPTLFDMCEAIHTRWQALIAINMILDNYVRIFANHKEKKYLPSQKLKIILTVLKKTLSSLENPMDYVVSGDTLREIHDKLIDTFKLADLEANSLKKSEMLNLIYNLGLDYNLTQNKF